MQAREHGKHYARSLRTGRLGSPVPHSAKRERESALTSPDPSRVSVERHGACMHASEHTEVVMLPATLSRLRSWVGSSVELRSLLAIPPPALRLKALESAPRRMASSKVT